MCESLAKLRIQMNGEPDRARGQDRYKRCAICEADEALRQNRELVKGVNMLQEAATPWMFARWEQGRMSTRQLRAVVIQVYALAPPILSYAQRKRWLAAFSAVGFFSDSHRRRPTKPVKVWRAQVGRMIGLSWSRDRNVAMGFHEGNVHKGFAGCRILHGFADPANILANLDNQRSGEAELLVTPTPKFWTEEP